MKALVKRFLGVQDREMTPFLFCFGISFFIGYTFVLGESTSNALFLKEVGPKYFPLIYAVNSVFKVVAFFIYSYVVSKAGTDKTFYLLSIFFGILLVLSSSTLFMESTPSAIFSVLMVVYAVYNGLYFVHFGAYLIEFFDIMQSKRLFPVIFGSSIMGAAVGGFMLPFFLNLPGGSGLLLLVWAAIITVVSVLIHFNSGNRTLRKATGSGEEEAGIVTILRESVQLIRGSRFIMLAVIAAFFSEMAVSASNIIANTIFATSPRFPDSESLIAFYGKLEGGISLSALILMFVIIPPLIRFFGVTALNLILPIFLFIAFAGLFFGGGSLIFAFAIFARFNVSATAERIEPTANNLLLNSLQPAQKAKVLALTSGLIYPIGAIISGLLLTKLIADYSIPTISAVFFVVAALYILTAYLQNRLYIRELMNLLQSNNFNLFKAASEGVQSLDPQIIKGLEKGLISGDVDNAVVSAQILAEVQKEEALPALCRVFPETEDQLKSTILHIFAKYGVESKEVLNTLSNYYKFENSSVMRDYIIALSVVDTKNLFAEKVTGLLDEDRQTAAQAAAYLLDRKLDNHEHFERAMGVTRILLLNEDKAAVRLILDALETISKPPLYIVKLLFWVVSEEKLANRYVSMTLYKMLEKSDNKSVWEPVAGEIRPMLKHWMGETRLLAFGVLKRVDDLRDDEVLAALGDSFGKLGMLARRTATERDLLPPEKVRTERNKTANIHLWKSMLYIEVDQARKKGNSFVIEVAISALEHAGNTLNQIVYMEKRYGNREEFTLLKVVLNDRLNIVVEAVIRTIDFLDLNEELLRRIGKSLSSTNTRTRASALETLENLKIKGIMKISKAIDTLLSDRSNSEKLKLMGEFHKKNGCTSEEIFTAFIKGDDEWEKEIALYSARAAIKSGEEFSPGLKSYLHYKQTH